MKDSPQKQPWMFEVTAEEIARLVSCFYARVRADAVLGPVFNPAVSDWPSHEEKIAAFWRGAILREPGYEGNPMQIHLANPEIRPEHFPVCLALFRDTAERELRPETARAFAALADRIGKGLSYGLENFRREADAPPVLT
ncbi:group III truncated hemoglobin [Leisingera sp. HS039]|uniref:group III truncated hemoglobin n=1 Tax=Leisingera sp. HS039 TaxID=2818496 RepID=UPI001B3A0FFD|nr:group III truncated hemoglobin [Leisingera sp. HS039]MBQ4823531.1 group III truncated hemoglobin [Leisingera sp. HS039]